MVDATTMPNAEHGRVRGSSLAGRSAWRGPRSRSRGSRYGAPVRAERGSTALLREVGAYER